MMPSRPTIAVLGASGLIGASLTEGLRNDGLSVVAVARRFTPAQAALFGPRAIATPLSDLSAAELGDMLGACGADVVVNCVGVLQDGPGGSTVAVHQDLVARLLAAIRMQARPVLLIHLSVPGREEDDETAFSRTKRAGERLIAASGLPFVIARPGFVVAAAAFGGSALVRALAALPVGMPDDMGARPFAAVAMDDITRTIGLVSRRWAGGERDWAATWDLCEREPKTVAAVVEAFRTRFGGPAPRLAMPRWLLWAGARAGDVVARLGWSPPVRSTALSEMLRGVEGRPDAWMAATGIAPASLSEALGRVPTNVQERWFARLFLMKSGILAALALFWVVSGAIALTIAFAPASAILTGHGVPPGLADAITAVSSLADIGIGLAIAVRRSCRAGLLAGIALSLFYMAGAAILTPEMWVEPLGALVKTGPAIVLMAVALAILEAR